MAERVCLRILLRQELFRLGILYCDDEELQDANAVLCDVLVRQEAPMFVMRPSRRSRRRRSIWRPDTLPLYLSFSSLGDDADIVRLLCPSTTRNTPTIQHRDHIPSTTASIMNIDFEIPQSLPPTSPALSSSINKSTHLLSINTPTLVQAGEDWTFITHTHTQHDSTPSSEPETWILCDDLQQISPMH